MPKVLLARLSLVIGCALVWAGCTVHSTEAPPLSGPSEFALSFGVTATPDSVSQDGGSQSTIVVRAFDDKGAPKSGARFRLDMFVGGTPVDYGTLSFKDLVTGGDGRATSMYTAPAALPPGANLPTCFGLPGGCLQITATPVGNDFGTSRSQEAYIHLIPIGVILPPSVTPTASFTFSPSTPQANSPVQFDASASCAGPATSTGACTSGGSITSYLWEFSDGGTASGRLASHSFAAAQSFSVTLTVTNDRGVKASVSKQLSTSAGSAPTAAFVYSPTPVAVGAEVFFDASNSRPGLGHTIVSYRWNWGDNESTEASSSPRQEHDYQAAKIYTVVLTVTDEAGQIGTASQSVTVGGVSGLVPAFTINPSPAPVSTSVAFDAASSTGAIIRYVWDFGDSTPSVTTYPPTTATTHSFSTIGQKTITLTVFDNNGVPAGVYDTLLVQ